VGNGMTSAPWASASSDGAVGSEPFARGRLTPARALLGIKDLALQQEVLDYLDRDPRIDVVGAASGPDRLMRLVVDSAPDATVVCPILARDIRHPAASGRTKSVLVVAEELNVPVLREAIEMGASGVFGWPEERRDLAQVIARLPSEAPLKDAGRGRVIAVYGARGGAGATFIATQLSATFADSGRSCALVDLDADFAGLTVALGVGQEDGPRTIADLAPVMGELSPDHVEGALYRHPRGFGVLLGPPEFVEPEGFPPGLYQGVIGLLAGSFEVIVLHLPRVAEGIVRTGVAMADLVLLVATLDMFSLYGARRAMASLGLNEPPGRCRLVLNRLGRAAVTAQDAQRVLDLGDWVGVRFDPVVKRAQDRGELLRPKARRAGADVRALAKRLDSQLDGDPAGRRS
jgi:pilus assembly protein CpaE